MASLVIGHKGRARLLLTLSTALCSGLAVPAWGQAAPPPVRPSVDSNGVDLLRGQMSYDAPALSAGQDETFGLVYRQFSKAGAAGDTIWGGISITGSTVYVVLQGGSDSFTLAGSTYSNTEGNGSALSLSGNIYTYTSGDGTVAHFDKAKQGAYPYQTFIGLISDVTRPNGAQITYSYDSLYYCSSYKALSGGYTCLQHAYAYRAGSATSAGGYVLTYRYNPIATWSEADGETPDFATWSTQVGVSLTNSKVSGAGTRTQDFATTWSGGTRYTAITDAMGAVTTYRSINAGLAGIKRPGSSAEDLTIAYDGSGRVSGVTTPSGTTSYGYVDGSGTRTVTVTDPLSHATSYVFDLGLQRVTSVTNALGQTTNWQYDASGRVTRVTAPEGNYTQTSYDGRGNVVEARAVAKSGSGLADMVTTASYDATCSNTATCNQPQWTRDAVGNQTDYSYDTATGNLLSVALPAATSGAPRPTTAYSYAPVNGVQVVSGSSTCQTTASCAGTADEVKTSTSYNSNGLPVSISKGAGDNSLTATITIAYDDVGNTLAVDGPLAGSADTTTYRYDADRRLIGVVEADPDGAGPRKRRASKNSYDSAGRLVSAAVGTVTDASDAAWASFSESFHNYTAYNASSQIIRRTQWASGTDYSVADYLYDGAGRPTCSIVYMNPAVWGAQASSCAPLQTNGPFGPDRVTLTSYDAVGRVVKVTAGVGTANQSDTVSTGFTANGQVATVTDGENNLTSYEYDGFDRLLKTRYPVATQGAASSSTTDYEQLGYDARGSIVSRRLRDGTSFGFGYDALGRVISKDMPGSEPDVGYSYDLLSRTTLVSRPADGATQTLSYDALGRLLSEGQVFGTISYQHDLAGRRTRQTWNDGFWVSYDYDVLGGVTAIREYGAGSGAGVLASYGYDDLGRRTSITRGNGTSTSYGYDAVSRLTSLVHALPGTAYGATTTFSYAPSGQIASKTRDNDAYAWSGHVNVDRNYATNGLNQYATAGATGFGYDARGNLTTSGSNSYSYSSENLLKSASGGTSIYYDASGRLVEYDTSVSRRFVYDGGQIAAEVNNPSGAVTRRYVFGPGADEVVLWYEGAGTGDRRWLVADERGSIVAVTNGSGAVTTINSYDDYGIPASSNAGLFQYTGQAWLPEVGLSYYKARMYSPTLGRFMQTDPIGYADGINWYNYVGGDPVNGSDPSGLKTITCNKNGTNCRDENGKKINPGDPVEPGDEVKIRGSNLSGIITKDGNLTKDIVVVAQSSREYRLNDFLASVGPTPQNVEPPKPCVPGPKVLPIPKGYVTADGKQNRLIRQAGAPLSSAPILNPAFHQGSPKINWSGVFWDLGVIAFGSVTGGLFGEGVGVGEAATASAGAGVATGQELSHAEVCPK